MFCGVYKMAKTKSGCRLAVESKEHFIICCKDAKNISKSKKKLKSLVAIPLLYQEGDVVSTRFVLGGNTKNKENCIQSATAIESVVMTEQNLLENALQVRRHVFSGEAAAVIASENTMLQQCDKVLDFFRSDENFSIPLWLTSLCERFGDRIISNQLEFHPSYNIDTIWGKVYGLKELEFFHVFVHMCVFDNFENVYRQHLDKCALLRYGCLCDKHDRIHVHFVMVALKEAKVQQCFFNHASFSCHITEERRNLSRLMKTENISIVPSWPDHRHFHMKRIVSDMHLFNSLKYISTRQSVHSGSSSSVVKEMQNSSSQEYSLVNVTTEFHYDIQRQVDALIKGYITNPNYTGSHFNIFRPLTDDAPMWFAAVSHNGLYAYVRYLMDKRSIIDELDKVVVNHTHNCSLQFRHIMGHLSQFAIPLRYEDFLYHSTCNNKAISIGRRDLDRYIHLGRNEYMYLAKGNKPCCEEYTKDIFFANQPDNRYNMTHKQSHEHEIYTKWVEITKRERDEEHAKLKSVIDVKNLEIKYLMEKFEMLQNTSNIERELREKDKIISDLQRTNSRLEERLSHFSRLVSTKAGPYLASNDKSNV